MLCEFIPYLNLKNYSVSNNAKLFLSLLTSFLFLLSKALSGQKKSVCDGENWENWNIYLVRSPIQICEK